MTARLTLDASRDIETTLRSTKRLFGPNQVARYRDIINRGIAMLADSPQRATSQDRSEIKPGVRSFHLQLAAGRSKGAAHILYYQVVEMSSGVGEVVVLRILSDKMEPKSRVARALKSEATRK